MVLWPYHIVIWPYDIVMWPYDLVIWPYDIVISPCDMVIWPYGMVISPYDIVICPYDIVIWPYDMVIWPYDVASMTIWYGDMTIWYGDMTLWYGDMTLWYGDMTIWYGDMTTWYGDMTIQYCDMTTWLVIWHTMWWYDHMIGDWRLKDCRLSVMAEFSLFNDKLYSVLWVIFDEIWWLVGAMGVFWALAIPPWPSRCPKLARSSDLWWYLGSFWGHFGAHFGDWRRLCWSLQASGTEKGGLGQALRIRTAFSSILGSAPRRSGGFSLQRELCFHFGGQWQIMATLGSI